MFLFIFVLMLYNTYSFTSNYLIKLKNFILEVMRREALFNQTIPCDSPVLDCKM